MKQLIGRVASETLYYLGHWIHYPMIWWNWSWIYPLYNYLMDCSHRAQVWSGNNVGPWSTTKEDI
jgi:hypothetical protein